MSTVKWKLKNVKTGFVVELKNPLSRAGRQPDVHIICNSTLVSRKHANFFILSDGSLRVRDEATTNGTYVNGKKLIEKEVIKLKIGDKVALGFDPTTDYEQVPNATFYMFEVLAGDDPIPEIIIVDSESEGGASEKSSSEPLKYEECEQTDHEKKETLVKEYVANDSVKEDNLKYLEPSSSKCSGKEDLEDILVKRIQKKALQEYKKLLKTENAADINNSSINPLETKKTSEKEETPIVLNGQNIDVHNKLSDKIINDNLTEKTGNKIVLVNQENDSSKKKYFHRIIEKSKLYKETKLEPDTNTIEEDKEKKINNSLCIPDVKNKRIEVQTSGNIFSSSTKELNKKNEKLMEEDSTCLKPKNDNCKTDKENREELKNIPLKYKSLKVNVERLTRNTIYENEISPINEKNTAEGNIFQIPNCSVLSKRKSEDNVKPNTKKIKKTEDNAVRHTESTSSCKENFFNTQELLSVLQDPKEIDRSWSINQPSNLLDTGDSALKDPLMGTEKVKMESAEISSRGFTNEDIIIVDDDDDEDDRNIPCSQLFQSSQEQEVDNGAAEQTNNCNNDDSLFLNIKKELEELDKTDFVPCIGLDSDMESDWYSDGERNTAAQKVESDSIVPGTYHNFENNNVDILYYEEAATLRNKSRNEDQIEHEQNLLIEEPESHETLPPTEEPMKEIVPVKELRSPTVPTSSFYPTSLSAKKYVIPPIVEPHGITRNRRNSSRRECSNSRNDAKKRRGEKTSPKNNTTKKDRILKAASSNIQRNESKRDEIRKKIKAISAMKPDQKPKQLSAKKGAIKVKVSEGRGKFLLENDSHDVKNVRKVNTNKVPAKPPIRPSSVATSSKDLPKIPKKINTKSTSSVPKTDGMNTRSKATIANTPSSVQMKVKMDVSDIVNQVIHWSASWLSQQKDKTYSPQVNIRPPVEMRAKFLSYSDYYNVVIPLLLLELWNSLYKDWSHPGKDLRKTTFCSRIEDEQRENGYTIMNGFTYIDKERNGKGINLKEDDLVVFEVKSRLDNKKILRTGFGFVTCVTKKPVQKKDVVDYEVASLLGLAPDYCVYFTFKTKSYGNSSDKGNVMFVRLVSSMGPYLRLFKSVKYLQFSPLKDMVLNPKIENFKVSEIEPRKLVTDVKLNKSQLKAVLEATELCLSKKPGLYLIQGPPGTGKTTVITSIIQEIVFSPEGPPRCVLLVAPSNGAVDELVNRLIAIRQQLDDVNRKKFKVVRVGPPNSIHPKVGRFSLEYMTKLNFSREVHRIFPEFREKFASLQQKINDLEGDCRKTNSGLERLECAKREYERFCVDNLGRKYFAELDKIRWSCLYNANIICTTLSSCFSVQMEAVFRNSRKITCCIVDEATQSNEQETLIPLMLGLEKIVLVGDPRQLCPTTLSQEAKQLKYGMSLFSRISNQFEDKPDNPIVMLDTQYRMHPEIAQFPSKVYYGNRLKNGSRCLRNKFSRIKPYVVFNLAMYCPVAQYRNENEVAFIIKLLNTIVELTSTNDCVDIGIITPYNNQKVILNDAVKQCNFRPNVKVVANTVDSFQGQERDIIIVSYVRMDSNSFVGDDHRLNVALTRAKHALFVVGNKFLFDTCSVLKKISDNARKRNLLYIVDNTNSIDLQNIISQ